MDTLKAAREKRGIMQKAVADAIGVTRQTYAAYENDPRNMSILHAKAACEFIGCDINDISFSTVVSATEQGA